METGTLRELNVKPGDVVEWQCDGEVDTVVSVDINYSSYIIGPCVECELEGYGLGLFKGEQFRIVSRASDNDTPKLWRDKTDAEKVALLLAHHEGKIIEYCTNGFWRQVKRPNFLDWCAYRVKPETVRETVELIGGYGCGWGFYSELEASNETHRITFDLIDGETDCGSIKMEKL